MKVMVTGVAGFIGSHVADLLLQRGHIVVGIDNLSTGSIRNVPGDVVFGQTDVRAAVANTPFDVVVHLAAIVSASWPDDNEVWDVNVNGTKIMAGFAPRIVFASTAAAYSPGSSAYADSKIAAERLVSHGTVLRYANVHGPRQRSWGHEPGVLAAWGAARSAGKPIRVDGDGTQTRDFIHVDDVARATVTAVETDTGDGQVIDICTGRQTRIIDLARQYSSDIEFAPRRAGDPDRIEQDPTKAAELLRFTAERELV